MELNKTAYTHKKFEHQKRKRDLDARHENVTLTDQWATIEDTQSEPAAKRKQINRFFRPWADSDQSTATIVNQMPTGEPLVMERVHIPHYKANMARRTEKAPRSRSPKDQLKRDKNTIACLLSRRTQQAQHAVLQRQYAEYNTQYAAILEQSIRMTMYYRHLLEKGVNQNGIVTQPGLPHRQQNFLSQMSLSQQLTIFGCTH